MTAYDVAASTCLDALQSRHQTVGTAESLTAGLVTATLATVPGASRSLRGGIVAYAAHVKTDLLGIDPDVLARHGVYSTACAEQLAARARVLLSCDWGLGTTGVAGPGPEDGHPAGDVHVAVAGPDGVVVSRSLRLPGDRQEVRRAAVDAVLTLLLDQLA